VQVAGFVGIEEAEEDLFAKWITYQTKPNKC